MPRRKTETPSSQLFRGFVEAPWWVGPIVIAVFYVGCRWLVPGVVHLTCSRPSDDQFGKTLNTTLSTMVSTISIGLAPYAAAFVGLLWAAALLTKLTDRRRFDGVTGRESILEQGPEGFERLIGEFYRRQGYQVRVTGSNGGDGGIDVVLERDDEITLVQCKRWEQRPVGVKPVRELFGVMKSEHARHGILVTASGFTSDAEAFAAKTGITLIDGDELEEMIESVQQGEAPEPRRPATLPPLTTNAAAQAAAVPLCPACNSPMVQRTARQGPHAGKAFWGCSRYPACKGIRTV